MLTGFGDEQLQAAKQRFAAFFRELDQLFIERQDVLKQIALALLSREHVLLTGPPGTAKSGLAHAVWRSKCCIGCFGMPPSPPGTTPNCFGAIQPR